MQAIQPPLAIDFVGEWQRLPHPGRLFEVWRNRAGDEVPLSEACRLIGQGLYEARVFQHRLLDGRSITLADLAATVSREPEWFDSWGEGPLTLCEVEAMVQVRPRAAFEFHLTCSPHLTYALLQSLLSSTPHC